MTRKVRVLLADDHKVVREGLRLLIGSQTDMEVIAEADNGRAAAALSQGLQPDIVVMDISMPEVNGLRATEQVAELCPGTKIVMLTRHGDDGYLQPVMEAGASGYVLKQSASEELLRAIRAVAAGLTYLDPAVTEQLVDVAAKKGHAGASARTLTKREQEVLRLIARGLLNREVADVLKISVKTVETHKANGMVKLGLTSRVDIIDYALVRGWLDKD